MESYVAGVSTRAVDDLVAALGIDSGISESEVSRICGGLDGVVAAFRTHRLHHTGSPTFPYVYLDVTYLHVRNSTSQVVSMAVVVATGITADGGREVLGLDVGDHLRNSTSQVVSMTVVVATGITADGGREVLGLDVGDSEDEVFWRGFLSALKRRGLTGVRLVISDQHAGLVAALKRSFQGTALRDANVAVGRVRGLFDPVLERRRAYHPQLVGARAQDAHRHGRRRVPPHLAPTSDTRGIAAIDSGE
jgi:putative transposase